MNSDLPDFPDKEKIRHVLNVLTSAVNNIRSAELCTFNKEVVKTADYDIQESSIIITFVSGRRLVISALRDDNGNPLLDFSC